MTGCFREDNIEYDAGESSNIIEQEGLTEQGCADLAAFTDEGNFWTFKAHISEDDDTSPSGCWVKKTNEGRRRSYTGVVSGNRPCGLSGKYSSWDIFN